MAIRSIRSNKVRAFLTMLGIIIGVASVIVLVSLGKGSSQTVKNQISNLGTNLVTVNITDTDSVDLKEKDTEKFGTLSAVKNISPSVSGRVTVQNGTVSAQTALTGTNADYLSVRDLKLDQGRFLSDLDVEFRQKTAVLGSDTAQTLFTRSNPVGQSINVDGTSFKVVGVLASKGSSMGQSGDDVIITPISTAQRLTKTTSIQTMYIKAKSERVLSAAMLEVQGTMSRLFPKKSDDYSVVNQTDLMKTMSSVSDTMTLLLGGIASISLIVGGIGIMNIMLVSVSERTKEIGIRKAIGANRRTILIQFLIEAIVLSSLGGIIGAGAGLGIAKLVSLSTGMAISYSMSVTIISFLFSLIIGVVFGVFPASKASRLHPIQALRYE
ncbi:ABC transporter permease [Bacillus sp. MUM 13]|uniref:ABC transporter permease n=1 Tax=Bacillus sp. MUM 13 TaxID=1678001 RepID=UPI0008F5A7FC|nr:ABC transporter permease [Bacillus sp. MUM 13]OIK12895.1 ABC transporter permease [Bacillus sp. MUM 13]